MKATRILALLTLVASVGLSACGGGGSGNSALPVGAPTSSVDAYTGPAPATADVQAFEVNLWNNIRGQNRCGQCHNATTPAQMPNFARSDNVNLAYAEANTVVNLAQPSTSTMVVKVSGGHNCWLADPSACGQILTTWISNWASATGATSATTVTLVAPPVQSAGQSLSFSSSSTAATDYGNTIYTLTSQYCSKCHSSVANPATQQAPYFADPNITTAYQAAIPKIDFTGCVPQNSPTFATTCGTNSRFYQRLLTDMHNCWSTCSVDAGLMLAQIQAFAKDATPTNLDPALVVSKALTMTQGTVAAGANRYDADTIAKYMFSEGAGSTVAYDTSGIDPAADLTLTGHYQYDGSWGVIFLAGGGKGQATVQASSKLNTLIQATGEFSIETWVAPAVVATNLSDMVSYSGGDTLRNFTLAQTNQDYDFLLRSSNSTGLNGMPQLQTPDATMALQATLQHVVLTYDPINGRQIYVNGVNQNIPDPQKGSTISNWDTTFALVLGSEVSGDNAFQGEIKFLAIHQRALTAAQVMQNFNAGVGQRYYLLFNISGVPGVNVSQAYMMLTVSQYDNYSYLFYQPTFISLDPTAKPTASIPVQGMRIGINGTIPLVGQAYSPLNTSITAAGYTAQGEVLSTVGTVIGLESGPATDQFFLQFDVLGTAKDVIVDASPCPAGETSCTQALNLGPVMADVGVRSFAQVNSTFAQLTGVPTSNTSVVSTYQSVQQQLPAVNTLEAYSSAAQVGVAQLAVQYCNQVMSSTTLQAKVFPGVTFNASTYSSVTATAPIGGVMQYTSSPPASTVVAALAALAVGNGTLTHQPAPSTVTTELTNLIGNLCNSGTPCSTAARVSAVTVGACAAALGNADVLID
jgi:Concanavalin A-like lectin/glucanases superfamily